MRFLRYKQTGTIRVGIIQSKQTHILQGIYSYLDQVDPAPVKSASACTTMTKSQRIVKEQRKFSIGQRVYKIVDELRLNKVVYKEELTRRLTHVRGSIQVVQAFISIRQHPHFLALQAEQARLAKIVIETAVSRSKYMQNLSFYEATILSLLYKEQLYMDKVMEVDVKISQFCMEFGVSGDIFHRAGKLVGQLWGHTTKTLLEKVGKV